jgi:5-oxoprolinase (ATP-hydrolysing) subunit C
MIEILSTGPLCSVQDAGRRGYRKLGVSVSGVMDSLAFRIGNVMLGNVANAASIEITVFPFRVKFTAKTRTAVTGAACGIFLDEKAFPPWWCFEVNPGQVLTLTPPSSGARAYLAVGGGIDVPEVLGSRSTDIKVGFGGFEGRCLRKGDRLAANFVAEGPAASGSDGFGVMPPCIEFEREPGRLGNAVGRAGTCVRVLVGPEYDSFTGTSADHLWNADWNLTPDSNRIGYRLDGPTIDLKSPIEMLSHGIVPGVIQVPPQGKPIVMMSDGQTSGGYPKIGTVIEADLWRLAQAALGSKIRFERVEIDEAVAASVAQEKFIQSIANSQWRAGWK